MDISVISAEGVIGGIIAILAAIYGVHRKLKADNVENVNQKAEINIIEMLIKQRDDAISLSDKYRDRFVLTEHETMDMKSKLDLSIHENIKLLEKLDARDAEIEVLKDIVKYLTETVSITRQSIEESNIVDDNIIDINDVRTGNEGA